MKKLILTSLWVTLVTASVSPLPSAAFQRGRVVVRSRPVVHRGPVVHTRLVVRPGHPLRRALPAAVVFRPALRAVVVGAPLAFLPALTWRRTVVALPPRERLVWEEREAIERDEGWVDSNFGLDSEGHSLFMEIKGTARLNFAEVTFANGNVQVVDFNEQTHSSGIYKLLDFNQDRHVMTVRILAKSESNDTELAVYLGK